MHTGATATAPPALWCQVLFPLSLLIWSCHLALAPLQIAQSSQILYNN